MTDHTDVRIVDSRLLTRNRVKLGFPFLLVPGDETHASILDRWVKSCDSAHHLPVDRDFVPNRLLFVGDMNTTCVRLVSDLATNAKSVTYVALSHRWGIASTVEDTFAMTTVDNIRTIEASEGVDDASLPKTFQDAVTITRQLGVKYLWIDSLCILQKADWERESELMEEIFGSAYVTIAASSASNRFEGFLHPRNQRQFVTMRAEDGAQFHVCEIVDKFEADVEEGKLNQRGWVLQERALSRRTLHFTSNQTYWECGEGIRCETFTKTTNRRAAFLGDSNFPHSVESFKQGKQLQHYHELYERYSSLALTYATDKPKAIAGLEKRLMAALKSNGGYGVFQSNFHRDLLWQRRNTRTKLKRITFPPEERVPSWSWMTFDGEIRYMDVALGDLERAKDISSPFESSSQAISCTSTYDTKAAYFRAPIRTLMRDKPAGMILDEPSRVLPRPLRCVIVGSNKQHRGNPLRHYALIVAPVEGFGEEKVVERVGVGYLSYKDVSAGHDAEFVNIQ
ncbi:hypothetical protein CSPX01_03326 [Colletotrichum filicis]|nr:hypothetical protein CSPX01_03326 [Colletotrichum filicis]